MLPLLLFAGYIANVEEIVFWLRWLQYISPIRYMMESTLRAEYRKDEFSADDHMNQYPVDAYNYDLGMGWCFGIMAMIAVGVRILGYFFLKFQTLNS